MDRFLEQIMRDIEHDRNAPWWKAKRRPDNLFDQAPIFSAVIILVWVLAAAAPLVAMSSKSVACFVGSTEMWCPADNEETPR